MSTLFLPPALPVAAEAVRGAAGRARLGGEQHRAAADALVRVLQKLGPVWRGEAARAALSELSELAGAGRRAAEAHHRSADVLERCAAQIAHAEHLLVQAQVADRLDAADKKSMPGLTVPPWLEDSPLRRRAVSLLGEAHGTSDAAVRQAAVALVDIAASAPAPPPGRAPFHLGEQLLDVPRAFGASVADTVRTAWKFLPARAVEDPEGWWEDATDLVDGVKTLVGDPIGALPVLLGLDLLGDGEYGTWLGGVLPDVATGVLSGGSVPAARRGLSVADELGELAEDVDDLQRVVRRVPDSGGPVVPGPGATMEPGMVDVIADLTPERRKHILDGDDDGRGGGHRSGTGKKGKSEFPADWSDERIIETVMETAMHPQRGKDAGERYVVHAVHDDVEIRVVIDKQTREVVTAFPVSGRGVIRNPRLRGGTT